MRKGRIAMRELTRRTIFPIPSREPEIGQWLGALEETRQRTKRMVINLDQQAIDAQPPGFPNSIGTLLYHIALIEADYLYIDVMGHDVYLPELQSLLPFPDRDEAGRLWPVIGAPIHEHIARLDAVRWQLIDHFSQMPLSDFEFERDYPEWSYTISPRWTLHHLMQHEAEHRGEMGALLTYRH